MALKRVKNCQYWVAQFVVNGRTITRSTGQTDKRKAKGVEADLKRQVRLASAQPGAAHKLSEARVAEVKLLETDVSTFQASRLEYALWNFEEWAGDRMLDRIDQQLLEQYQRHRLRTVAKATVDKELWAIVRMLKRNGLSVEKPKPKPGKATEQRAFSTAELKRFFEHCPDDLQALFLLMLCTGARPAELIPSSRSGHIAILKNEVDYDSGVVMVRSAKKKLNEKPKLRRIKVQGDLLEQVKKVAESHSLRTVFLPIPALARVFNRILTAAKIEKFDALGHKLTAHSFRHTFATMMADAVGHNPFAIQHILGHSQITTTARYCHPTSQANVIDFAEIIGLGSGKVSGKMEEVSAANGA